METPFAVSTACERSFGRLKKFLVSAPILCHLDPVRKIVVETDNSNLVVATVLSQYDDDILHLVAYFSRKRFPPEINYEIYDKELLANVQAVKECHPFLEGSPHTIEVTSNH
jgi:hypothetical protein